LSEPVGVRLSGCGFGLGSGKRLIRRVGLSGCKLATLDSESFVGVLPDLTFC
jgi:hypothetical protein